MFVRNPAVHLYMNSNKTVEHNLFI